MNNAILITILISLFTSFKTEAQQDEVQIDVTPFMLRLDSLGVDTLDHDLVCSIGRRFNYYGHNDKGNALIEYTLSKKDTLTDEDYHDWSVLNTKNGNYAIAIDKLEKAMDNNPEEIGPYYGWVILYYYRDYEKALKILEQVDAYTPNFSDAPSGEDIHYLKGLCHMQMQHPQKAIDEFNTYINNLATTHGEDFVDVYTFVQKGRCLTQLGRFEEAITSFQKAIRYYEDCTEAHYFMGITQMKMNNQLEACLNFNIALDMINRGEKSNDVYVELFHEIYPDQIQQKINENCK
jgi:tetratricopeptide (TPR) repeat protein